MQCVVTYYPSLLVPGQHKILSFSVSDFRVWLASFPTRTHKLDADPAFGPYVLADGLPRSNTHVEALTMAVFDVDHEVTPEAVERCDSSFGDCLRFWVPSFRHTPEAPRYRLIVPLETPLAAKSWQRVRGRMLAQHHIPADPKTSNSISHSYYVPSGPVPVRFAGHYAYQVHEYSNKERPLPELSPDWSAQKRGSLALDEWKPLVEKRIKSLKRKKDERYKLLEAVLEGRPIAEHGQRDAETTRTAALLVYALPDAGLEDIVELMEPSLEAMQAEGSKLQLRHMCQKVESAMRKRAQAEARYQMILKQFSEAAHK